MLTTGRCEDGDGIRRVGPLICTIRSMPGVFRGRSKQLEEIHQWLGAYFQATAIMLQLPGGPAYQWLAEDPDDAEDFVWVADRDMLFCILAYALEHLDAQAVMDQIPGADSYKPRRVPIEFQLKLARRDRNGVLNLVATCLDRLMVIPALPAEERCLYDVPEPRPRLWRRCWRGAVARLSKLIPRRKQKCTD